MAKSKNKCMDEILEDTNVLSYEDFPSPKEIHSQYPLSEKAKANVLNSRIAIKNILDKKDSRKIVICGPCSIHNPKESIEYAKKLKSLSDEVGDVLYLVMRTYLEKPRTTIGWKGLLYDPFLDESNNLKEGIKTGREFLLKVNELGLPCANEFLRTDLPQYFSDLISWGTIGARTTESQIHRELASGLSMPIGFKNNTSGDIKAAIDGCLAARCSHKFLGINSEGKIINVRTKGNKYSCVVLRGGNGQPNYSQDKLNETKELMKKSDLQENIIVDCSHANSNKVYEKQIEVAENVLSQISANKNDKIIGIMLESNHNEGNQKFPKNSDEIKNLKYGVSITDSCISWEQTKKVISKYAKRLREIN